jgi:hypothetical protein
MQADFLSKERPPIQLEGSIFAKLEAIIINKLQLETNAKTPVQAYQHFRGKMKTIIKQI